MKFYTLAMFILLFNVSLAILNFIDVGSYQGVQPQQEWLDEVSNTDYLNQSYASSSVEADDSTTFGNFKKGLSLFIKTLFYATIGFPWLFISFGLNSVLAGLISLPIYIIYVVGLIQLFSKQPLGGMR